MKVAVVGSRTIQTLCMEHYIPKGATVIVSGGAKGVDTLAREYAVQNGLALVEFLPDYKRFGKAAPLVRNRKIVEYCDCVVAIWDGISKGTMHAVHLAQKLQKPVNLYTITA